MAPVSRDDGCAGFGVGRCSASRGRVAGCDAAAEGARVGGDAGLGLCAGFIGARRPGVWQAGRCIGLGLVLESRLPMGETRLG
jgi:hypothetical protein